MSEFAPLEERIKNAMQRISAAVAVLPADQSAALAERDARIAGLEEAASLAANVTDDMEGLRAELEAKTTALEALEQAPNQDDEIAELRAQLEEKTAALEAIEQTPNLDEDLAELRAQLDAKNAELEAATSAEDEELRAARDAEIEATLLDLQGQLSVREDEIKELKAAAEHGHDPADFDAQIAALQEELRQKDAQLDEFAERANKASAFQAEIATLTASLAAKDAEIASMAAPGTEAGGDSARVAELEADLERERAVNADLGGRVATLKSTVERNFEECAKREAARVTYIETLDEKTQRLQHVNAELRTINGQLRKAAAEGTSDAELINRAMEAELDALRAARDSEAAEVSAILNELQPIIEGTS